LPPFVVGNQRAGKNQNRGDNEDEFHKISGQWPVISGRKSIVIILSNRGRDCIGCDAGPN
jgi:hypothetical protein